MKYFLQLAALTLALQISCGSLHAQFRVDTVRNAPKAAQDSGKFHMTKSPMLALGLSAILPGAGQVYLDQWWKVPIIYAGFGTMLYGALIQNFRYHYISDSVNNQLARGDIDAANRYAGAREFYRDDRDKFYIYGALFYLANILDAYIASHLYDFDVSDESSPPPATTGTSKSSQLLFDPADRHVVLNFHLHLGP